MSKETCNDCRELFFEEWDKIKFNEDQKVDVLKKFKEGKVVCKPCSNKLEAEEMRKILSNGNDRQKPEPNVSGLEKNASWASLADPRLGLR